MDNKLKIKASIDNIPKVLDFLNQALSGVKGLSSVKRNLAMMRVSGRQ